MAVFFLLVGLEIKRELLVGELSSMRKASLPIVAALGGMLVPALMYVVMNVGTDALKGWGIPMATDIAFALAVLQLMGPRCPIGLKLFLTALAIIDDLGAILVIALFYTASIAVPALLLSLGAFGALVALNKLGVRALTPYLLLGVVLWLAVLSSGIHATVAGVILAMTIPVRTYSDASFEVPAPLLRLEHLLTPLVSFAILPLFALANAGVSLAGATAPWASSIGFGVLWGLLIGKPLGIVLFSWVAIQRGWSSLPRDVSWKALGGAAWLGGIGFTMALFIAQLAFGEGPRLNEAKLGIMLASILAGTIGWWTLRSALRPSIEAPVKPS